jgi:hypothetical protein
MVLVYQKAFLSWYKSVYFSTHIFRLKESQQICCGLRSVHALCVGCRQGHVWQPPPGAAGEHPREGHRERTTGLFGLRSSCRSW